MIANITARLGELGINQKQLAARANIRESTLSNYMTGRNGARVSNLKKIAEVLGVSPEQLLQEPATDKVPRGTAAQESAVAYDSPKNFDVHFDGPLLDQPHVDLPYADAKVLATFDPSVGLSLLSLAGSRTLRLYLKPGELASKYSGAMVVELLGDSMEPVLHSGDRMIVWQIPESKWHTLHNTAAVVFYDDTVTVKAIRENELLTEDRLTLRAANPKSGFFTVGLGSIRSIWEVREYYDRPRFTLTNWSL